MSKVIRAAARAHGWKNTSPVVHSKLTFLLEEVGIFFWFFSFFFHAPWVFWKQTGGCGLVYVSRRKLMLHLLLSRL